MSIRPVIAFLLIFSMTLTATGSAPRAYVDDSSGETDETRLTADEELEARSIAEQFIKRFEESDNLLSIVNDLYVKDFDDRLRRNPADRFIVPVASDLAERIKGDELSRYHITSLKFTHLYMLLLSAAWYQSARHLKGDANPEKEEREFEPDEILPPRLIALLKDDPAFAELFFEDSKKDDAAPEEQAVIVDDSKKRDDDRDLTIKTIERLRDFISKLEQSVVIMREHLRTLPVPQTWQSVLDLMVAHGQETKSVQASAHATTLARADFGCPEGTRLINFKVMPFRMELIRVDGQLKILSVYVFGD